MAMSLMRRRETREPTGTLSRLEPLRSLRDWDPFGIMRELLRFDPFSDLEPLANPELSFIPRVNLRETADSYVVSMELPGIREENVEISISGNRLTISGELQDERRDEGDRYHAFERVYGRFSRSFTLPEGVDPDKVKAELREGVLEVTIPKQPGVQAKRIPVEASKRTGEQQQQQPEQTQQQPDKQVKVEKAAA
jgi:HSP20 family protein